MKEPPRGSVVMTDGPTGTAWQRHHHDGRWHSTAGSEVDWSALEPREPELLFEAPGRAHDGHEIRYTEFGLVRETPAVINGSGDVEIDPEQSDTDFTGDTQTSVRCATCNVPLTPENSGLADDWEVIPL